MPNANTIAHRSIPFTAAPFTEGGSGLLEPNLDRIEASPFVCFATTQEPVYKLVGHRTVVTPDEPAAPAPKSGAEPGEPTFTAAEVEKLVAAERAALEHDLAKRLGSDSASLRAELDRLRDVAASGSASATRVRLEQKAAAAEQRAAEQSKLVEQLRGELRTAHLERELGDAMAAAGIANAAAARAATTVFRADARIEHGADGRVLYVEVEGRRFVDLEGAVKFWAGSAGRLFQRAPEAGAGGSGSSSVPLYQRSTEENINEADRVRARRR